MANHVDLTEIACAGCGSEHHIAYLNPAAHDPKLIDLVVECAECGRTLNEFVTVSEMLVVSQGSKAVRNA